MLARRVSGNREAILALALLTVSYHHIWFSQNARAYTGLLAATLVSTWLLLEALSRDRLTTWFAYAMSTAVGMWLHLTFAFVPTAHAIAALALALLRRSELRSFPWRSLGGFLLAATLAFQVYALLLPQVLAFLFRDPAAVDLADFEWREPWWLLVETLRRLGAGLFFGEMLVAVVVALSVVGLVSLSRRDPFVTVLFVLPSLLCLGTLLLFGRSLWPRFFFGALGFGVVVIVRGAVVVAEAAMSALRRPSLRRLGGVGFTSALVVASAAALPALYRYPKQDFTGARDWVVSRRQPNDTIVALDLAAGAYLGYYAPEWKMARSEGELRALRSTGGATWVVYTFPAHLADKAPDLMRLLREEFELERAFPGTLGDGVIVVRRAAPPAL